VILSWLRNPSDWVYRLLVLSPALAFTALVLTLPDPAGFDGARFRVERYVGSLDQNNSTIDDVKEQPASDWQAMEAKHHFGVKGSIRPIWYRIHIPSQLEPQPVIAEIGYHLLRKVDFYLLDDKLLVETVLGGLERPAKENSPFATIKVLPDIKNDRELYLRLEPDVAIVAPLFIGSELRHGALMNLRVLFHAMMSGIFVGLGVYNLVLLLTLRKSLYAILFAAQLALFFFPIFFSGQIFYIWPNFSRDLSLHLLILAEMILMPQLLLMFLNQSYVARDFGRSSFNFWGKLVIAGTALEILIAPIFRSSPMLVVMVAFTNVAVCSTAIFDITRWPIKSLFYYRLFLSAFMPGVLICICSWFGIIPSSYFGHYFVDLAVVFGFALLSAAMTHRIRQLELKHRGIVRSLRNDSSKLSESITDSELNLAPISSREIDVTIMYIDIMSFSLVAERESGQDIFSDLTRRLSSLTRIVLSYNGVIDRSLGDGLLCFFTGKNEGSSGHANDAFNAAFEIQNMLIDEALRIKKQGQYEKDLLLPVRIGIHSDKVLLANLGGGVRVDFTMIGHGVNFVASLEQSCGPFNIMISESCYQKLVAGGRDSEIFSPVRVSLKYQKDLVLAYEFSTEKSRSIDLKTAVAVYFTQVGVFPRETRHSIVSSQSIILRSHDVQFQVLDYSPSGMRILSDTYFAQKVIMEFAVDTGVESLNQKLQQKYLDHIIAEVRWSRKTDAGYEHGIKLIGGNQRQIDLLIHIFSMRINASPDAPKRRVYGT